MVVMGDFNGKVGDSKVDDTVGPFGLGERNDNGESPANQLNRPDVGFRSAGAHRLVDVDSTMARRWLQVGK